MVLRPPVEPMPAQAAESVTGPAAVRAGVAYEQKDRVSWCPVSGRFC